MRHFRRSFRVAPQESARHEPAERIAERDDRKPHLAFEAVEEQRKSVDALGDGTFVRWKQTAVVTARLETGFAAPSFGERIEIAIRLVEAGNDHDRLFAHVIDHPISTRIAPPATRAPGTTATFLTTPLCVASMRCSIFIASRTTSRSRSATESPGFTATLTILPGIGEVTVPACAPAEASAASASVGGGSKPSRIVAPPRTTLAPVVSRRTRPRTGARSGV